MASGSEKYQADRENNQGEASDSSKKVAKVAAKGAADYFTGGKGGAIVDKVADTKLGQAVLNNAGKMIDKNPLLKKSAEKLDKSGAADAADKGLSMMESGKSADSKVANSGSGSTDSTPSNSSKSGSMLGHNFGNILGNKKSNLSSDYSDDKNEEEDYDFSANFFKGNSNGLNTIILGKLSFKTKIIIISVIFLFFLFLYFIIIITNDLEENSEKTNNNGGTNCTYKIDGVANNTSSIRLNPPIEVSNLKVRLMECDGSGPVPGEELIDFEKYILGVTYQENGNAPDEAVKVQAIAARSYSLSRPTFMGNGLGTKLSEENGQWILQLRSCTNDHAYCDPDKGCSSNKVGGEGATIYSGQSTSRIWNRGPLPQNAKLRALVAETAGQVLVDNNNYIINTGYKSTEQNSWNASANSGLNYKQILLQQYPYAADISKVVCSTSGSLPTGDFTLWKQFGAPWSNILLGNSSKTIGSSGCLVTSIAMLIAQSGVNVIVDGEFNPGTFVQKLNANGGFIGADLYWSKVSTAAPSFIYQGQIPILGFSQSDKLNKINELLNNGYYITAEVKGNTGQHWVAIVSTDGSNVNMLDPASDSTSMWQQYNWVNTSTLAYFKVI